MEYVCESISQYRVLLPSLGTDDVSGLSWYLVHIMHDGVDYPSCDELCEALLWSSLTHISGV